VTVKNAQLHLGYRGATAGSPKRPEGDSVAAGASGVPPFWSGTDDLLGKEHSTHQFLVKMFHTPVQGRENRYHSTVVVPMDCQPVLLPPAASRPATHTIRFPAKGDLNVIFSINVSVFPLFAADEPTRFTEHWLF